MSTPIITTETITPAIAADMLTHNTRNRIASQQHVAKIARAMKEQGFHFTGDPIRFAEDGTLLDGQHRLKACILADTAFSSVIIRNLPLDALMVIDGGKSRTRQQQLHIADGIDPFMTDTALMVLRMGDGPKYDMVPTDTLKHILDLHPQIADTAAAYKDHAKFGLGANLPAAELILRANGYQLEADAFRAVWTNGTSSEMARAAHGFREKLILWNEETSRGKKVSSNYRRHYLAHCILRVAANADAAVHYRKAGTDPTFPAAKVEKLMIAGAFSNNTKAAMTSIAAERQGTPKLPSSIAASRRAAERRKAAKPSWPTAAEPSLPMPI
jgi:hypothetical protein